MGVYPQSRQSARLFLQSSELGPPPQPSHPQASVSPPVWFRGGGTHSLGGEGVGGSHFGRGDRHCGTLGIYVVFTESRTCISGIYY
jgi:hypothetical protein